MCVSYFNVIRHETLILQTKFSLQCKDRKLQDFIKKKKNEKDNEKPRV